MKRLKIALWISSVVLIASAQANFSGFSVGIGTGLVTNKDLYRLSGTETDPRTGLINDVSESTKPSKTSGYFNVDLGYGVELLNHLVLNFGVNSAINQTKSGKHPLFNLEGKVKNHISLYVAPGLKVKRNILLYSKFAYHRAKVEYSYAKVKPTFTHSGASVGAGAAYAVSSNVEVGAEINYIMFGKKDVTRVTDNSTFIFDLSSKPRATEYTLLFKYRF